MTNFGARLSALPHADRVLLKAMIAAALGLLGLGVALGLMTALARAGLIAPEPDQGYAALTLHSTAAFFYWLYLGQSALLLAFAAADHTGPGRIALAPLAWFGFALMLVGFALNAAGTLAGEPLLYDGPPELATESRGAAGIFYLGYIALALGLIGVASAAIATAFAPKLAGRIGAWSTISFGAVVWAGLLVVSALAALNAFLPAAIWAFGGGTLPIDHSVGWHLLFHNMHYLPLIGTLLTWYVLVGELTGVTSLFGSRFSKLVFCLYLVFVPPTSLYHMFLEPGLAPIVRLIGSLLSLFISVPTVAAFLLLIASLEASARARGARGLFGWIGMLPWRDPAMSAIGMAVVNLAIGGALSFVLIQERLAPLLSDTFFVPGYFHFLTIGAVSLTLLAAFCRVIPALNGGQLRLASLLARLPYALTLGLILFGGAGVLAGLRGMPRRVLDAGYDGASPAVWASLSTWLGVGGAIMTLALALYVGTLLVSLMPGRVRPMPTLTPHALSTMTADAALSKPAWSGPLSVIVLVGAMVALTIVAFRLMQSLPIAAIGGGGH